MEGLRWNSKGVALSAIGLISRMFQGCTLSPTLLMAKCRHPRTPIMGEVFKVGTTMPASLEGSRAAVLVGAQAGIGIVDHKGIRLIP